MESLVNRAPLLYNDVSKDAWHVLEPPHDELSLFPLRTVLFPGMPLPLHIFEERYKCMIEDCVQQSKPFGVVLIQRGREVGGEAEPFPVGTSAVITKVTRLRENRLNILTVGYQRFRILSLLRDRPFLRGVIQILPPVQDEATKAYHLAKAVSQRLPAYVDLLAKMAKSELELSPLPEKPALLAFLTAILLQIRPVDKQALLAAETIPDMLALELCYLAREQRLLRAHIGIEYDLAEGAVPFSEN